jgi:ubiquitin carboxyl-terminal hydrolase 4/11/15
VPDIFAVHLKRFSSTRSFRDKLDNLVEFPLRDFDLTDRVGDKTWIQQERGGEELVYDLFAVDNHYGGLGGGHYTAYAQNFADGEWYYYDGMSYLQRWLI